MYYRIAMNYCRTDFKLSAVNCGFEVNREYRALDNSEDAVKAEDGIWHIKIGSRVQIQVKFISKMRHYHVAMVDNLAAGFEVYEERKLGGAKNSWFCHV